TVVPPIGREEMSKNLGFLAHSPCLRYRGCPPMGMCRVTVKSSQPGRGRTLKMEWDGDSLIGTRPVGTRLQVFLKSPTEEAPIAGSDRLVFVLDKTGHPTAVSLMHGGTEIWRAEKK